MVDYSRLPPHTQEGFERYIRFGVPMGDFGTAVVENNLMRAFGKADETNIVRMFDICSFLYNEAPAGCYGSPERVAEWIKTGGLEG